jgi:hypothetical protein
MTALMRRTVLSAAVSGCRHDVSNLNSCGVIDVARIAPAVNKTELRQEYS